MGQRDDVEGVARALHAVPGADDGVEPLAGHELEDGELADGDDELGFEQVELGLHPKGAVEDLVVVGDAVAAGGALAGEAAADGGHVDAGAEGGFVDAAVLCEPAEKFLASGPRKGAAEDGFLVAGRLADEDDAAEDGAAADDGLEHVGAAAATPQRGDMAVERAPAEGSCGRCSIVVGVQRWPGLVSDACPKPTGARDSAGYHRGRG
jgi:hypothetical protein